MKPDESERLRLQVENLDAEVECLKVKLRESIKNGKWLQGELTRVKGEFVVLKHGHTWEKEREAIVDWLKDESSGRFADVSLSYESQVIRNALVRFSKSIERGEHWPTKDGE